MLENEKVVLVDKNDNDIGVLDKLEAHKLGLLHRAFSVLIFNSKNELLLQRRASNKYHSPNLWTNTCCSHPRENEPLKSAASRRLKEEMGMHANLEHVFKFIYKTNLDQGMIEHELDHVFIGYSNVAPKINLEEVSEYKYCSIEQVEREMKAEPEKYTVWFKILWPNVLEILKSKD